MPRFMAIIVGEEPAEATPEEWQAVMDEYNAFGAEAGAAGVIAGGGEALQGPSTAVTIHVEGGKGGTLVRADGPFIEAKESVGGFYLIDAADIEEAIQWAAKIPGAWHGSVEVRPCIDFG
jgi:hypothetical protein